jgi:hypothetical protein
MGIYEPTITFVDTSAIQKQYDLANVKGSIDKHTAEEKEDFFKQLVMYEECALSVKIDLTDDKKVSKYLSAIPNNSDKPQTSKTWRNLAYVLWSLSKVHKRDYLPLFIEWSNLAKERYGDETKQCRRLWEYYDTHNYNVNKCAMNWLIRIASHYVPNDVITNEAITEVISSVYDLDLAKVPGIKYCEYTSQDVKRRCLPLEFNVNGKEYKCVVELAGLGLGKTHIVMKYISTVRPLRVLMIGCRKTFGREKYAELREIVDDAIFYNDPTTNKNKLLKYNKLVIQYESLHLLKTILQNQRYDLVIIDELEGCLDCVNQDTNGNNKATNLKTLKDIVKYATKVYCADAFLTNRSLAFLQTFAKDAVLIRKNDYVRSNRKAYIVKRIAGGKMKNLTDDMTRDVLNRLKRGENLCVCVASREYAEELYNRALDLLKDEHLICFYSSMTCDIAMNEHFEDVKRIWGAARLVIYTSIVTVGVNYDDYDHTKENETQNFHFDTVLIQASNRCPNVRNTLQGHFRVRHTREPNIYLYVFDDQFNKTNTDIMTFDEIHESSSKYDGVSERGELYSTLDAHAKYEDRICRKHYSKVLHKLLERCGYEVIEPEAPSKKKTKKAKLPEVEDKLNDFTLSLSKTLEYIMDEDLYKQEIDIPKTTSCATTIEKYYADAVTLMKHHLNKSKSFETEILGAPRNEETDKLWKEIVKSFNSNKSLDTILYNIRKEKEGIDKFGATKINDKARLYNNRYSLVTRLLPILGEAKMYNTNDMQITEEQLVQIGKMYKALSIEETTLYKRCFNIEINTNNELRVGKTVLTNVLKVWSGYHLDVVAKSVRIDGTVKKEYSYFVENEQDGADLVNYVVDNYED